MIVLVLIFFFFFQAEDGIRDYKVTGVQTCALPICAMRPVGLHGGHGAPGLVVLEVSARQFCGHGSSHPGAVCGSMRLSVPISTIEVSIERDRRAPNTYLRSHGPLTFVNAGP